MLQNCSAQKSCRLFPASRGSLSPVMAAGSFQVPASFPYFLSHSGTHGGQVGESQTLHMQLLTAVCTVNISPPTNVSLRTSQARTQTTFQVWDVIH